MPTRKRRTSERKNNKKKHRHIFLILILIVAALFIFYDEFGEKDVQYEEGLRLKTSRQALPEEKTVTRPEIAVVIDDLGYSKKAALDVFNLNIPLTLSVLPHERYTRWIAEEGHSLGYDVIGHMPMEAMSPHDLGKGGLYTSMTDDEIIETLTGDIDGIPHIEGVSNHMGSAFTRDERAMSLLVSVLQEHGLFFLDSLTTSESIGYRIAREQGIKALKRDVFLDNEDDLRSIEIQWEKAVAVAARRGYAVVIAHAKKNTIAFLKKTLPSNRVSVVPLSELAAAEGEK
jgi:polysaccharide deacetylase 2 family uncharacterized protein YibQ